MARFTFDLDEPWSRWREELARLERAEGGLPDVDGFEPSAALELSAEWLLFWGSR